MNGMSHERGISHNWSSCTERVGTLFYFVAAFISAPSQKVCKKMGEHMVLIFTFACVM